MDPKITQIINDSKASQDKEELKFLYEKVSRIKPKVIVEIGTWMGYFAETLHQLFSPEKLITIENDPQMLALIHGAVNAGNFNKYNPPITLIDGVSYDVKTYDLVVNALNGRTIDFLFIDGDHRYEAVKKDFETYLPLMSKNGIIGFHDVALIGKNKDGHDWFEMGLQVNKFWEEIKPHYSHAAFQGSNLATGTGLLFLDEQLKTNLSGSAV